METIFEFHPAIEAHLRLSLEEKIKEDAEFEDVKPVTVIRCGSSSSQSIIR